RGLAEFAGELPVAALAEEIITPGVGQVRALVTSAGNPVLSTPNGSVLAGALKNLDFMLSIDIYRNETTRHADLILPPASPLTQYHYDLIFNVFAVRRVARLSRPMRLQTNSERADWEIFTALAEAVSKGAGKPFNPPPDPLSMIAAGLARGTSGLSVADLLAAPHGLDLGPLRPNMLSRLETPSGAIECAPALMLAELERLGRQPAPDVSDASLRLIGRREIRSNNSWMHNAQRLIKGKRRHQLWMHPSDMLARQVVDGGRVRVRSRVGAIEIEVSARDSLLPGVVCLPHGYGHHHTGVQLSLASALPGESYNDLSDPLALDEASGNAALNGLPVWVEAVAGLLRASNGESS
ncbi:MAG: molybdopterin dinucleotide binding domain-containing protein, partial [Tahibacter sp.]